MVKPLHVPKTKQFKCLKVMCYQCNTFVYDVCRQSGKALAACKHPDKHRFKIVAHVSGTKHGRKTKVLDTRDFNEAVKETIAFTDALKSGGAPRTSPGADAKRTRKETNKPELLIEAIARFISLMHNENVPGHLVEERSARHLHDLEYSYTQLVRTWQGKGYDMETMRPEDADDDAVGVVHNAFIHEKRYAATVYNRYMANYKRLFAWLRKTYGLADNPFERITPKHFHSDNAIIEPETFRELIDNIDPSKGMRRYGTSRPVTVYTPYLAVGLKLLLLTGSRINECVRLRFSDIVEEADGGFIRSANIKVNNIQRRTDETAKKFTCIPLTKSLRSLLADELNWDARRGSDAYLLAPDSKRDRDGIAKMLSKGFHHYYHQLFPEGTLSVKCLRKTHISLLDIGLSDVLKDVTGHAGSEVLRRHYVNPAVRAKWLSREVDPMAPYVSNNRQINRSIDQTKSLTNNQPER